MLDVRVAEAKAADAEGMRRLAELGEDQVVCTACPVGCVVGMDASGAFSGHSCERGLQHAKAELLDPRRMFTGTVRLVGGDGSALLPVRTSREIPRDMMMPVAKACRRVRARGPVRAGDVLRRDVAGSGADLVACATVEAL